MSDRFSQAVGQFTKEVRDRAAVYLEEGRGAPDACLRMAEGYVIHHRTAVNEAKRREDRNVIPFGKERDGRTG